MDRIKVISLCKKILFLSLLAVVLGACAPRIHGRTKHKKQKNCGCDLITPDNQECVNANYI